MEYQQRERKMRRFSTSARLFITSPNWGYASGYHQRRCCPLQPKSFQTVRTPLRQHLTLFMTTKVDSLGLPPTLRQYVERFASVPDPKLRYQQLLFFAKELPSMDPSLKTDENRVYGCTSVVHVHVSLDENGNVQLQGDSDSQLTKGLLALLVNGFVNCKPDEVTKVDPQFITYSGLTASLTPSRNNGFVSMLAKIKKQVANMLTKEDVEEKDMSQSTTSEALNSEDPSRPVYSTLVRKLSALKPSSLQVIDNSEQHAGHAGALGLNGESHFALSIVAEAFEGLSMVQRHRLVYTLLDEEMRAGHIHALQIDARSPSEKTM